MKKRFSWLGLTIILIVMVCLTIGCGGGGSGSGASVKVFLKDAPGPVEEVNVTVKSIGFNIQSDNTGWQNYDITPTRINLLNFTTSELDLGTTHLPPGLYHQIRLVLEDNATVKFNGDATLYPLEIPSADITGLKINLNGISIDAANFTELIIDVDISKFIEEYTPGYFRMRSTALQVGVRVVNNLKIVFETDKLFPMKIYIMDADGSNVRLLSDQGDLCPDFSPDHTKIAFHSSRDGNLEIYTMDIDGSNQQRLTYGSAQDACAVWSPDGSQIAFQSDRDASWYHKIYVMNADGTSPTRLSELGNYNDQYPSWSPDGSKIIFHSDQGTGYSICTMNPDGTNRQTLLSTASGIGYLDWPSWSKDGSKIVFVGSDNNNYINIYTMNADGTGATPITNYTSYDIEINCPAWSPDGSKIAYHFSEDGAEQYSEIYVINSDGSGSPTKLTTIGGKKPKW